MEYCGTWGLRWNRGGNGEEVLGEWQLQSWHKGTNYGLELSGITKIQTGNTKNQTGT